MVSGPLFELLKISVLQAGNLFKMAKLWKEAGDAFVKAAEIHGPAVSNFSSCVSALRSFRELIPYRICSE